MDADNSTHQPPPLLPLRMKRETTSTPSTTLTPTCKIMGDLTVKREYPRKETAW